MCGATHGHGKTVADSVEKPRESALYRKNRRFNSANRRCETFCGDLHVDIYFFFKYFTVLLFYVRVIPERVFFEII